MLRARTKHQTLKMERARQVVSNLTGSKQTNGEVPNLAHVMLEGGRFALVTAGSDASYVSVPTLPSASSR